MISIYWVDVAEAYFGYAICFSHMIAITFFGQAQSCPQNSSMSAKDHLQFLKKFDKNQQAVSLNLGLEAMTGLFFLSPSFENTSLKRRLTDSVSFVPLLCNIIAFGRGLRSPWIAHIRQSFRLRTSSRLLLSTFFCNFMELFWPLQQAPTLGNESFFTLDNT